MPLSQACSHRLGAGQSIQHMVPMAAEQEVAGAFNDFAGPDSLTLKNFAFADLYDSDFVAFQA